MITYAHLKVCCGLVDLYNLSDVIFELAEADNSKCNRRLGFGKANHKITFNRKAAWLKGSKLG